MRITLSEDNNTPIYQQIVDTIAEGIHSGTLPGGLRLPTVRDLATENGVSRGTVKHAYDCLGQMGLVEMTQGRGTFVRVFHEPVASTKERAMQAIDTLLDHMRELSFSPQETRIFFELKLREREDQYPGIRVGAVDCSTEALSVICRQLSTVPGVDVRQFLLEDVLESPRKLRDNLDLLVTTATHFAQLEDKVPAGVRLMRVVLTASSGTVLALGRLDPAKEVGIVCKSLTFANVMRRGCDKYSGLNRAPDAFLLGTSKDIQAFVTEKDALLLPANYHLYGSQEETQVLARFEADRKTIIHFDYQVDRGSLLYIEERIKKLLSDAKAV